MTELKTAEQFHSEFKTIQGEYDDYEFESLFKKIFSEIQQNAIEAALELAASEATTKSDIGYNEDGGYEYNVIDKQSILSLINHPKLKV